MPNEEHTHVAPAGQPGPEFFGELLAHFRSMAESLAVIAGRTGTERPAAEKIDQETQAIAYLATIGPNVSQIAKALDVPRSTLYGWTSFREALERYSAMGYANKKRKPRGFKAGDEFDASDDLDRWDR